jgi:hypothetical protein
MKTSTYKWFWGFWIVWDFVWFAKNLIQGDLTFMIVFGILACVQTATYIWGVKQMELRDIRQKEIDDRRKRFDRAYEER